MGEEALFDHHNKLAEAVRAALIGMGLELLAKSHSASGLTAVKLPTTIEGKAFVSHLRQKYGVTVAGGQGALAGKIVRIAHKIGRAHV